MPNFKHKAICHTKCYWLETLWEPGEVYEGDVPPIKHFSKDGTKDPELPPPDAGSDPRSNDELRKALKKHPFNFSAPRSWNRKRLWARLQELEIAYSKDAAHDEEPQPKPKPMHKAPCGFKAKSPLGLGSHKRACRVCQEILNPKPKTEATEETQDGNTGEHMQSSAA